VTAKVTETLEVLQVLHFTACHPNSFEKLCTLFSTNWCSHNAVPICQENRNWPEQSLYC